jgi:hypothetical protein
VGHLHEHSRAIPRAGISPDRAAVHEVHQNGDAVENDLVRAPPVNVYDETHAAAGMLEEGIVEPITLHPDARIHGITGRRHLGTPYRAAFISHHASEGQYTLCIFMHVLTLVGG